MSTEDTDGSTTVEQLRREIGQRDGQVDRVIEEATDPFDGSFGFEREQVTDNLEALLVALVALRAGDTHGKALMDDLVRVFDTSLSPGTVYPRLHDLEDQNLLERRELVRTKEYALDDPAAARDRLRGAMEQHLALGLFLRAALDET